MTTKLNIEKEDDPSRGRFVTVINGQEAELTYTRINDDAVIADHTGVPDELAGNGIGSALVRALVDDARQNHYKIVPLCPFVAAQYARHPEWSDVMM